MAGPVFWAAESTPGAALLPGLRRGVSALRRFGTPLVDLVGPTRHVDHQSGIDDTVPHGWHYYWKGADFAALSDEVIDIVADHPYDATSARSYAAIFHLGGAVARAAHEATAYSGRDLGHTMSIDAGWLPEHDDAVRSAETRGRERSLTPLRRTVPAST